MAAQLFMWLVAFVIVGFLWFWIVRPILEDWGVIGPYVPPRYDPETKQIVKDFAPTMHAAANDMSTPAQRTATDGDGRTDGRPVSAPNPWMERLQVDRTRAAVIELLVYSGWRVEQIRTIVKGENGAIGSEVDAARQRLGVDEPARVILVSKRGGEPTPLPMDRPLRYPDDPSLEFKAP